jgi:UPF0288 family protein (methanogenesis marker protein 3)
MPDTTINDSVNRPRLTRGMNYALRFYPGVVGQVLADELESWGTSGYMFGGKQLIDRLIDHLEKLARAAEGPTVVHRVEVEE